MKQTTVKFYHVGDNDYQGTTLIVCKSRKDAMAYIQDWINAHSTKLYTFKRVSPDRWESKFTAIYYV